MDRYGRYPLITAAAYGHVECVDLLLQAGADVNQLHMMTGMSSLSYASRNGHVHCVEILLKAGAKVDIVPFTWCNGKPAINDHGRCVQLLLQAGATADVNKQNQDGYTFLMSAATNGHWECIVALLDAGADVNIQDYKGTTALMEACDVRSVELLLQSGADVNKQDRDGRTAVMKVAWNGHHPCMELLLQAGAGVNKQDKSGQTSLMYAAENGNHLCAELLLQARAGADVNIKDYKGTTALMEACDARSMELLLQAGADVNKQDREGKTALMYAAMDSHWECVKTLLHARADVNVKPCGETVINCVLRMRDYISKRCNLIHKDRFKSIKLLLPAEAKVNDVQLHFSKFQFRTEKELQTPP